MEGAERRFLLVVLQLELAANSTFMRGNQRPWFLLSKV